MEIRQLDSDVVDKIAAGEVVERPSHLLKELLENSIDAGATEIDVEVDEGGRNIRVLDNGKGVLLDDLPRVFSRHATSKISQSDDLWKLSTFGFRGEALASISSVSSLDFISRRQGEEQAYRILCDFGKVGEPMESSLQEGTQVHVQDLFKNIPARLKFLKSDAAEITQIKNVVKAMGLQYPNVQWKLKAKGKLVFFWKRDTKLIDRVQKVLDVDRLYECDYEYEGFKAKVIFSDPSTVVKVSRQIWTFVQNRWVQDRTLQAAVMEAYRSLLMHGQYPICYVSVTCPTDEVDVNIHPTKSQVKFVDSKKAFRVVHYALREAVEKAPWLKRTKSPAMTMPSAPAPTSLGFQEQEFQRTQFQQKQMPVTTVPTNLESFAKAAEDREPFFEEVVAPTSAPTTSESTTGYWSSLQVIGQIDLTYIVTQAQDKMVLVDQHAAHERVAFEKLMAGWKSGRMEVQAMLLPLTVDMDEAEVQALVELSDDLLKMGIQLEQAGPSTIALASMPTMIREKGLVEALRKMARESLDKGGSFALETAIADIFATMACHSVVRAGQALSPQEMKELLVAMDEFPLSGYCPHGRSVSLDFSFAKLETDFGRRV